jgi:DGQHR domain-containing protein
VAARRRVPALRVHQWLPGWSGLDFSVAARRARPKEHFYLFAMKAGELKALSGINRRAATPGKPRSADIGVQRRHEEERSRDIRRYVEFGAPWADLTDAQRRSGQFEDLRKPGWLPTAVVVNFLRTDDERPGGKVAAGDIIEVSDSGDRSTIHLPETFDGSAAWRPRGIHPIEVIDGQHRLWAFDDQTGDLEFELPVVAFEGLDVSWQAYLFWSINIKPKRINASLAFDLYPLLRNEDWLERGEGHSIYRETRAQELVEALWAHPSSPWHNRINMLGDPGAGLVRQASWVRNLVATFVKRWEGPGIQVGGLYGAPMGGDDAVLPWSAAQQAAYLIQAWALLRDAIKNTDASWTEALRGSDLSEHGDVDPAFGGDQTLLNTDPGVRGCLYVFNDLSFVRSEALALSGWTVASEGRAADADAVTEALKTLRRQPAARFLNALAERLASFDWRSASAPGLTPQDRVLKQALRGSGGYRLLREALLNHLLGGPSAIASASRDVIRILGY